MATMNVSLPDQMKDWIDMEVDTGRYASASDYIRDLVRERIEYRTQLAALDAALEKGRKSGVSNRTIADIIADERARRAA